MAAPSAPNDWRSLLRQGNYLGAVRALQQESGGNESYRLQSFSWLLGAVGRYREAQQAFNQAMGQREAPRSPSPEEREAIQQVPVKPAEQVVLEAVKRHQIVILNETHHQPEHRAFAAPLIPSIKAAGVEYLALENGNQAALDAGMQSGRIGLDTDFYAMEPQRAELLRAVLCAGLKLVAFDHGTAEEYEEVKKHPDRSISIRETWMARNLEEQILRHDPSARVLIWVGMSHACKRPQGSNEWMALRLWKRTGIEPFSIYQMSDTGDPAHDEPIYHRMMKVVQRDSRIPVAVRLPADARLDNELPDDLRQHPVYLLLWERGVDAVILHPQQPFESAPERPAWHQQETAAQIHGEVVHDEKSCVGHLVQALPDGEQDAEDDLTAPADQVLTDAQGRYVLQVRPGRYRLRVWAPAEHVGEETVIAALSVVAEERQTLHYTLRVV